MRPSREELEAHIVRLTVEVVALEASRARLASVLIAIADEDFRGNRSPESEIAHRALVAEGLRPSTTSTTNERRSL